MVSSSSNFGSRYFSQSLGYCCLDTTAWCLVLYIPFLLVIILLVVHSLRRARAEIAKHAEECYCPSGHHGGSSCPEDEQSAYLDYCLPT
jgi:hypothetical protein